MRRRHMTDILSDKKMSFCGHEMTRQEYICAKDRDIKRINCKRCLEKYKKYMLIWGETLEMLLG